MHSQIAFHSNAPIPAFDPEQIPVTDKEFENFLKGVRTTAYRIARYHVMHDEVAHDVVQNAMIELMKCRARRLLPAVALGPMFNTILKRCVFAQFNSRRRKAGREILFCDLKPNTENPDDFDFLGTHQAREPRLAESSADVVERNEVLALIDEAAAGLPDHQRQAFLMRYAQDMEPSEIAASMGRSSDAVQYLYQQARKAVTKAVQARLVPACPKPIPVADRPVRIRMPRPPRGRPSATVVCLPKSSRLHRPTKPKYPRIEALENGVAVNRFLTHDIYTGEADALVSAGIIEDGMLPGRLGRPSKKVTIKFLRPADGVRYIQIIERTPGTIEVRKAIPDAEADQRRMGVAA
ncbi:sigma-70 family RNA polymerase sigma factor [Herbaspirillum sp. GCM10030257]|uniref:sigma-70 family RNA polymerase sigma factor n=1 Tax=Herbaspirillum sp. GCM10030257 TaxID=3273393 RepID=UPI003622E9A4